MKQYYFLLRKMLRKLFMKNCKYLKQKLNRKLECKRLKKIINIKECENCTHKLFANSSHLTNCLKKWNRPIKRPQAVSIRKQVKLIVWERDNRQCIFCHTPVPWNLANSHFIKRSHGGLGIPENLFCNCLECHNKFDNTINRKWMLPIAKNHLMKHYKNWNKNKLIYKKYYKK